jgi:hypothetical protein
MVTQATTGETTPTDCGHALRTGTVRAPTESIRLVVTMSAVALHRHLTIESRRCDLKPSPVRDRADANPSELPNNGELDERTGSVHQQQGPACFQSHRSAQQQCADVFQKRELMHAQGDPSGSAGTADHVDLMRVSL